jgi:AraC-like DNA-binding protein
VNIRTDDWLHVPIPEMERLDRPIVLRFQDLARRHVFPRHSHHWNQFVYATAGTLIGKVGHTWFVIPPEQALWVPTGCEHTTGALQDAKFRNLYIDDSIAASLPKDTTVFSVTPLMRALIVELADADRRRESDRYFRCIESLILEQLVRLPIQTFHLPWPQSPALNRLCLSLFDDPCDDRDLESWGRELGASARTLHRHFEREVGIGLREWRNRLRFFKAVELLGAGRRVTDVALDLGYATPSAFTFMFRQRMGCGPAEWQRSLKTA